ncbi:MAG TPA: hypothetical protein PKK26_01625 [Candidatus Wallbacteria bacterium]|nr:hypothetical protein [Candidatus Wallbacteria bacterium]
MEEDNYFFKKRKDGTYKLIKCNLGCEKMVGFIKFENKIYTIERNIENQLNTIIIYSFENEKFKCLFKIEIQRNKNKKAITVFESASKN